MKKDKPKAGKKPAKNKKVKKQESIENELFNFDNEIVIGVTKLPEPKKEKKKVKKKKTKQKPKDKPTNKNGQAQKNKKSTKGPNKKIDLKKEKRKRRAITFLKAVIIITVLIGALLALMLSPLFKIEKIEIQGTNKVSNTEVLSLSEIKEGENIFLINKNSVINKLKQNPYIENVKIKKSLPGTVTLEVTERQAKYCLKYSDKYIYINNQGYILEIADTTSNLPEIISYRTSQDKMQIGGRLSAEDLELLGTILKIMEAANNNGIGNLITSIDIANKNDIILRIESER